MPVYTYKCPGCGEKTEIFIRTSSAAETPACPHCGSNALQRVFSDAFALSSHREEPPASSCCGSSGPCEHPKSCCQSQ